MGSGSILLFYIWQAKDWHHHTLHFSIQALALLYSIQLPVPSWRPQCCMYLIPEILPAQWPAEWGGLKRRRIRIPQWGQLSPGMA